MRRFTSLVVLASLLSGCYTLRPAEGITPEIGQELAFDINDAGRVALGGAMGPEIAQVQGRLVSRENAEYLVAVNAIRTLAGGDQAWSGEEVHIKPEYVKSTYQRQFSKARTVTLGVVTIAGFAFLVTRGLIGGGTEDPVPTPPGGAAIRVP